MAEKNSERAGVGRIDDVELECEDNSSTGTGTNRVMKSSATPVSSGSPRSTTTKINAVRHTSFIEYSKADETPTDDDERRQQHPFSFSDSFRPNHPDGNVQTSPRLIDCNLYYHQSHNQFNVKNTYGNKHDNQMVWSLYKYDWFHVMLRWPTLMSVLFLIALWTTIILIFAKFYMLADKSNPNVDCGLYPNGESTSVNGIRWHTAFAFSLQTCTTVGYTLPGTSSAFFKNCPSVQVTIYFQMLFSMMFNAFLLAFFFSRLGRCEARAYQVVFTDKACIRRDYTHGQGQGGRLKFECKVYDADSRYPVVEAHVRMYVVHCRSPSRNYWPLRITIPNDELGGKLCTSIPSHVSHFIDLYSPLLPPQYRPHNKDQSINTIVPNHGLVLREVDSYTGSREGFMCPVCGESYGTFDRFVKHVQYNKKVELSCDIPEEILLTSSHHVLDDATLKHMKDCISLEQVSYDDIHRYWQETKMEVVVIVEGIDPLTSGTFQALHSYQAEDICYGGTFAVSFTSENTVDFDLFQTVEKIPNLTNSDHSDDSDEDSEVDVVHKTDFQIRKSTQGI